MLTRYSKKSIQRLTNRFLSLRETQYFYHHTLTFWPAEFSEQRAKRLLDALLSNLHHRYEMASLHVRHYHRSGAIHYHVLFAFFDSVPFPPSRMQAEFGTKVFNAWNRLQGGRLVRCANRMQEREHRLDALKYLLRRVRIDTEPTRANHWWTYRNDRLFRERGVRASLAERKRAFEYVMPHRPYKRRRSRAVVRPVIRDDWETVQESNEMRTAEFETGWEALFDENSEPQSERVVNFDADFTLATV